MAGLFADVKSKVLGYTITVDGDRSTHDIRRPFKNGSGTYDRIIRSIKELTENGYTVEIRINVDKENLEKILPFVKWISRIKTIDRLGISLSRIEEATNPIHSPIQLTEMYELMNKLRTHTTLPIHCNIPIFRIISMFDNPYSQRFPAVTDYCDQRNMWVIDSDGKIYSCNEGMGETQFLKGFIDNPPNFINDDEIVLNGNCSNCEYFTACCGNCSRINYYNSHQNIFRCELQEILSVLTKYAESKKDLHLIHQSLRPK
jgi:uncharacterized protein